MLHQVSSFAADYTGTCSNAAIVTVSGYICTKLRLITTAVPIERHIFFVIAIFHKLALLRSRYLWVALADFAFVLCLQLEILALGQADKVAAREYPK